MYPFTMLFKPAQDVSVAPMMAYTDRHFRMLARLASPSVRLFTEMITTGALLHGDAQRALAYSDEEHPIAVQLGGNDAKHLARSARLAEQAGFDEINLNVGCPSSRVQEGGIGACLMAQPHLVADCVRAMQDAVSIPVTVKCRLGIDQQTTDEFLDTFIGTVAAGGCSRFYLHARIALLSGLSPAQNRSVPPLQYDRVRALKIRWPNLQIILNGGLDELTAIEDALSWSDGVMIGRAAYHAPMLLAEIHRTWVDDQHRATATEVADAYQQYMRREAAQGTPASRMTRHALGLFNGQPGAKRYRQVLSNASLIKDHGVDVLSVALEQISRRAA